MADKTEDRIRAEVDRVYVRRKMGDLHTRLDQSVVDSTVSIKEKVRIL